MSNKCYHCCDEIISPCEIKTLNSEDYKVVCITCGIKIAKKNKGSKIHLAKYLFRYYDSLKKCPKGCKQIFTNDLDCYNHYKNNYC